MKPPVNMKHSLLLTSVVALVLLPPALFAEPASPPAAGQEAAVPPPSEWALPPRALWSFTPAERARHVQRLINLSEEQMSHLRTIFEAQKAANDKIRADYQGEAARRPRFNIVNERTLVAIKQALGDETFVRYEALVAEDNRRERERWQQRRANQGT